MNKNQYFLDPLDCGFNELFCDPLTDDSYVCLDDGFSGRYFPDWTGGSYPICICLGWCLPYSIPLIYFE